MCYLWSALTTGADVGLQTVASYTWRVFQCTWSEFKSHCDWCKPSKHIREERFNSASKLHMCCRYLIRVWCSLWCSKPDLSISTTESLNLKRLKLLCNIAASFTQNHLLWRFEQKTCWEREGGVIVAMVTMWLGEMRLCILKLAKSG